MLTVKIYCTCHSCTPYHLQQTFKLRAHTHTHTHTHTPHTHTHTHTHTHALPRLPDDPADPLHPSCMDARMHARCTSSATKFKPTSLTQPPRQPSQPFAFVVHFIHAGFICCSHPSNHKPHKTAQTPTHVLRTTTKPHNPNSSSSSSSSSLSGYGPSPLGRELDAFVTEVCSAQVG